jgi:DNA polymerase III sliding clamp (beta) subunit (PCNA family)
VENFPPFNPESPHVFTMCGLSSFQERTKTMNIILPIAELKPALAGLGKIISKRTRLPVLSHVKVERTNDGWIALTGTNLDSFATVRLEQPSTGEPGCVLVPMKISRRH